MRTLATVLLLLAPATLSAQAVFERSLTAITTPQTSSVVANSGQASHMITAICSTAVADVTADVQIRLEGSLDGSVWFPISPDITQLIYSAELSPAGAYAIQRANGTYHSVRVRAVDVPGADCPVTVYYTGGREPLGTVVQQLGSDGNILIQNQLPNGTTHLVVQGGQNQTSRLFSVLANDGKIYATVGPTGTVNARRGLDVYGDPTQAPSNQRFSLRINQDYNEIKAYSGNGNVKPLVIDNPGDGTTRGSIEIGGTLFVTTDLRTSVGTNQDDGVHMLQVNGGTKSVFFDHPPQPYAPPEPINGAVNIYAKDNKLVFQTRKDGVMHYYTLVLDGSAPTLSYVGNSQP